MNLLIKLKDILINNELVKLVSIIIKNGNHSQTIYSKYGNDSDELLNDSIRYIKDNIKL